MVVVFPGLVVSWVSLCDWVCTKFEAVDTAPFSFSSAYWLR